MFIFFVKIIVISFNKDVTSEFKCSDAMYCVNVSIVLRTTDYSWLITNVNTVLRTTDYS